MSFPAHAADPAKEPPPGKLESELVYKATVGTSTEVKDLLNRGARPDKSYNTENAPALALAAQRKDIEAISVIGTLINGGANINIKDGYGQSPLFYAARAGLVDNVRYLLERGAVYYQVDKKGNIARTIAHNEGHEKVVQAMDEFVSAQTKSVMTAYADRDKKVEAQYKKQSEAQIAALSAARKHEQELEKELELHNTPAATKAGSSDDVDEFQFKKLVYDVSYHSCAAAYWEYCRSQRLSTTLGHEGVKTQLEAHEILAKTASDTLINEFNANKRYLSRIIGPSRKNLLDQFKVHPTNAHLKADGVGTKEDLDKRCGFIAESWDIVAKKRKGRGKGKAAAED